MALIKRLSARLQNHPKRVVFPEGTDLRILQAARQFATRKLGVPILIGNRVEIEEIAKKHDVRLDGIRVITPEISDEFMELVKIISALPKFKGFTREELVDIVRNPAYFATLMLATGRADAMVAGATVATASTLRPIFQIIPLQKGFSTASSMMVVATGNENFGIGGDLFLSDCGVIPEPTDKQLCDIAVTTAGLVNHLTLETPRVAMLSYVSKLPTAKLDSIIKVKSATALAHAKAQSENLPMEIDGELQVDAALRPDAAAAKGIKSSVAGRANVLIFPDLSSGNIASKMIQALSGADCYGQVLTGLTKPVAEISRGATVNDIFGTSVIVAAQAVDRRFLTLE